MTARMSQCSGMTPEGRAPSDSLGRVPMRPAAVLALGVLLYWAAALLSLRGTVAPVGVNEPGLGRCATMSPD